MTFEISADGIVNVTAKDLETGLEQSITLVASSGLTEDEIERMAGENRDYLVALKAEESTERARQELEKLVDEGERLLPRVTELLAGHPVREGEPDRRPGGAGRGQGGHRHAGRRGHRAGHRDREAHGEDVQGSDLQRPDAGQGIALVEPTLPIEPVLVGRVIANHRLVAELGSGGMGKVFYAEHQVIGRRAAIKILNPQVAREPTVAERFLNEARAVNEIRHPNVVEITDIGRDGDLHFIVMQFLEGETLGERLEREKVLDEATVLRIARQVMSALGAAHEHRIVHRDLKPDNIFLTSHPDFPDFVKVLDFGIAKLKAGTGSPSLTKAGTVLGTPSYMSPEQCRGTTEIDARSDVYSLAVVLYQMLTGKLPFISDSIMDVMIAHVTTPPMPPIEHNAKISPHVNDAVMQALEKEPGKRFASMAAFWEALDNEPQAAGER